MVYKERRQDRDGILSVVVLRSENAITPYHKILLPRHTRLIGIVCCGLSEGEIRTSFWYAILADQTTICSAFYKLCSDMPQRSLKQSNDKTYLYKETDNC